MISVGSPPPNLIQDLRVFINSAWHAGFPTPMNEEGREPLAFSDAKVASELKRWTRGLAEMEAEPLTVRQAEPNDAEQDWGR